MVSSAIATRRKARKARTPERIESTRSRYALPYKKRMAIEALLHNSTVREAAEAMQRLGFDVEPNNLSQWRRQPEFIRAFRAREIELAASISKETVVLNAAKLFEEALKPRPILHKGEDTGFEEIELGHALTANEQMGKATGAFAKDEAGRTVVVIDIDFSGRKNPVQELVIEGEYTESLVENSPEVAKPEVSLEPVSRQSRPTGSGLAFEKDDSWLA